MKTLIGEMSLTKFSMNYVFNAFNTSYDCMSIMHYRDHAFAYPSYVHTMTVKDPNTCDLSTRPIEVSPADKDILNKAYHCKQ